MRIPKIKFVFDRRKRASKDHQGSVELRITDSKKQYFATTGVRCLPKQWNEKTESIVYSPDAAYLNQILASIRMAVTDKIAQQVKEGQLEPASLLLVLKNDDTPDITFHEFIDKKIKESTTREGTRMTYVYFLNVLKEYGKFQFFSNVTEKTIRDYDVWLRKRGYSTSTIWSHHKRLHKFINMAVVDEYLKENPYVAKRIKVDKGEKLHIDHITAEQVAKIASLELDDAMMCKVRDMFLFQCHTGMAYSDMMAFNLKNCAKGDDGLYLVKSKRIKTNVEFTIVLDDVALKLLDKYGGKMPHVFNHKYNQFLKFIGAMVGVPQLHSHMGRSTFATIMLNKGASLDIVAKMIGHTTTVQTKRYATFQDETIKRAFGMFG